MHTFFKSALEQDPRKIVLCDRNHRILYMNPAAIFSYEKYGGAKLVGRSLLDCHNAKSAEMIEKVVAWFAASPDHNLVHTFYSRKENKDVYMIALRDEAGKLIGYYEKHEYRTRDESGLYRLDG